MLEINQVYNSDCIGENGMCLIDDKSIDMILCDLPYGTTACKWDAIIPFEPLWQQYERIIKDNGAIVLTASQPFTTSLIASNLKLFKYCWVWDKKIISNPMMAKKMPLKQHEDICIFYKKQSIYNPIKTNLDKERDWKQYSTSEIYGDKSDLSGNTGKVKGLYPKSIIQFSNANQKDKVHPTQKPVALFEYLINTYTNENDLVLDNCMGSFTTAVACKNTGRNYIGFENDEKYYELGVKRLEELRVGKQLQ